jgi:hypothetical protein
MLDRLLHHSTAISIQGESYRSNKRRAGYRIADGGARRAGTGMSEGLPGWVHRIPPAAPGSGRRSAPCGSLLCTTWTSAGATYVGRKTGVDIEAEALDGALSRALTERWAPAKPKRRIFQLRRRSS